MWSSDNPLKRRRTDLAKTLDPELELYDLAFRSYALH